MHSSLGKLKSHKTCLCCAIRMPEKVLSCGHAYCDICIQIFGTPSMTEKNTFSLHSCVLCGGNDAAATFSFIPPTAGIRILTLDGGGVRGIVELVFLEHLESKLSSLKAPLQSYFDFICGTSAGKYPGPVKTLSTKLQQQVVLLSLVYSLWNGQSRNASINLRNWQ